MCSCDDDDQTAKFDWLNNSKARRTEKLGVLGGMEWMEIMELFH